MKYTNGSALLEQKGLKKTKLRLGLIQYFLENTNARSYADLKEVHPETDKSTLYRNLSTFESAGLIHRVNDHTGIAKYAFGEAASHGKEHAHFVCDDCETVYCVEGTPAPKLEVPSGFKAKDVETIIRGTCANC